MGQKLVGWALLWPVGEELDQTDWAKEVGTAWICVGEPVAEQFGGGGLKLCGFWAARPLSSLSKSTILARSAGVALGEDPWISGSGAAQELSKSTAF